MLIDIIKGIPGWQSLSADAIIAYLAEDITIQNHKAYFVKDFEDLVMSGHFTMEEANTVLGSMNASPFFNAGYLAMSVGDGLELGSEVRQSLLTQLGNSAGWGDILINKVKSLGVSTMKRYEQFGIALPSVSEVNNALSPTFDSISKEVLFTYNKQANGQIFCTIRYTPVKFFNGEVVERGESVNITSGDIVDRIKEILAEV